MQPTPTLDDFRNEATAKRIARQNEFIARQDRFIDANPGVIEGLRAISTWNDFALSLLDQFERKADLSPKQIDAANRMLDKVAAREAKKAAASTRAKNELSGEVDMGRIRELFETAQANGLKKPKFYAADVKISLAPSTGRNAGALYVVRNPGDTYQGKIFGNDFQAVRECLPDTLEVLKAIATNPGEYARMTGKQTGRCCCCGRELTDPKSIADGIGPICADKWGI